MTHSMRTVLVVCCLAASTPAAAQDALTVARQFTAQLKLDQTADEKLFAAAGKDRSQALLLAVMQKGQAVEATAADWTALHRSITGLIELHIWSGDPFKASFYAGLQQHYYGMLEHDYSSALQFAKRAYELHEKSGQQASQFLNLKAIGENLLNLARPAEARQYFRRAQQCMDEPYSATAALTWRRIMQADLAEHDFAAAEADLKSFQDAALSGPARFRADSLLGEAEVRIGQQRFPEVLDALKRVQPIIKNEAEADSFAYEIVKDLLSCAMDAMWMLPFDESAALAKRIGSEFPGLPVSVESVAQLAIRARRRMAGDIEGILREDTERLRVAQATANVSLQIEALRSLATSYRFFNARKQEIAALEEAVQLHESLLKKKGQVQLWDHMLTLRQLAEAHLAARDTIRARLRFEEVLRIVAAATGAATTQSLDRFYGSAILGKARLAELEDDPDEARSILQKAIADPRFDRAEALSQFARLERDAAEKPALAADLYRQSLAVLENGRDRIAELATRVELALYLATGGVKLPAAAAQSAHELELVEQTARAAKLADSLWRVAYVRGILAENAAQPQHAIENYASAIEQLDGIRAGIVGEEQRQAFMDNATAADLYRRIVSVLISSGRNEDAWKYMERSKARAFLEMLKGRRSRGESQAHAELGGVEQRLVALEAQLSPANLPVLRSSGKIPAVLEAERHELQNRFALLRTQAPLTEPGKASVLATRPVTLPELKRTLPLHTALVEYYFLEKALCTFVVAGAKHQVICREVPVTRLSASVHRVRRMLASANPDSDLDKLLKELGDVLIGPALAALPGDIRNLVIVPAGVLNYIPFQVLPLASGGALIDRFTVSYLPGASAIRSLSAGRAKDGRMVLGALGNVQVDGLAPLPGTLLEVADIARVSPRAEQLTQAAFTHDALRNALETHDRIHIATHGVLDEQAPLFSALITSPAAAQPSRLSLYELTEMKLQTRLVVLSACETGLGRLMNGDEVAGLTRTFLQAGADTVVSSLWKVSDESTAVLMAEFHRRMNNGEGIAQALRGASLKTRKQFPQPFYWAPFILTGAR